MTSTNSESDLINQSMSLADSIGMFQIVELHDFLKGKHIANEISPKAFQELRLILKRTPHPAKVLNVLHLNMGVVISVSAADPIP